MSTSAALGVAGAATRDGERGHRIRIYLMSLAAIGLVATLAVYGFDYYWLGVGERPLSPKHVLLRPSGLVGIKLGIFGAFLFFAIYLYYFRKRWKWLGRIGISKHWLDIHVVLGLTAPAVIAFHAAFKFRGMAGMAFWVMMLVALSGVVGRYLYAQIPRSLNTAEVSWQELESARRELESQLLNQKLMAPGEVRLALRLPLPERARRMSLLSALGTMLLLDLSRPFQVAALRRQVLGFWGTVRTLLGLLPSGNRELEHIVGVVRGQSKLSKKMLFLSRSQQVFHFWHIIHRPFSYAFAVLACIHIVTAILLGYL
jgi:hypothetical protein